MNESIHKNLNHLSIEILEHIASRHENDSEWDVWELLNIAAESVENSVLED